MKGARNEWVWLLLAMGLFAVVAFWIIIRTSNTEEIQPAFSSYTAQPRGCRAVYELLEATGFSVSRHGGTEYNIPEDTCLALIADSTEEVANFSLLMLDSKAIQLWVEEGGRLVLITDPHSLLSSELVLDLDESDAEPSIDPGRIPPESGIEVEVEEVPPPVQAAIETGQGVAGSQTAFTREYQSGHRLELEQPRSLIWKDVDEIEIAQPGFASYRLEHALLVHQTMGQPIVMYEPRGKGAVYWLTTPEITTNLWIDRVDNHRLLLALFGLAAGGREIVFFEKIHGYTEQRHNVGSLLVKTHGGQLLLALGLCCALAFAPLAVRPARSAPSPVAPRRHTAEMIFAQADLYARAAKYHLAAERLLTRLLKRLETAGLLQRGAGRRELKDLLTSTGVADERGHAIISKLIDGARLTGPAELKKLAGECEDLYRRLRNTGQS